jgi:hypothetical protein
MLPPTKLFDNSTLIQRLNAYDAHYLDIEEILRYLAPSCGQWRKTYLLAPIKLDIPRYEARRMRFQPGKVK